MVGGPPCQGFSALNRHRVRAERNTLWQEFIRVVVALQPKVFVIENVDRFVRSAEFGDLQRRVGSGDLSNYMLVPPPESTHPPSSDQSASRYVLNAADFGSPQARRRAIVIGVRVGSGRAGSEMRYPTPTHSRRAKMTPSTSADADSTSNQVPWRTAAGVFAETADLPISGIDLPAGRRVWPEGVPREVDGPYLTGELHVTRTPESISLARYRAIPRGGNRRNLRGRYLYTGDDGRELILEKAGPARTIDGRLDVEGRYLIVVGGQTTSESVEVLDAGDTSAATPSSLSRSKSQVFSVSAVVGDFSGRASLAYLSTDAWDLHHSGAGDVMGRVRIETPSVTVRTEFFKPEKGRYLHPSAHRPITHYEAARIQGFPSDFRWCGTKSEIAKQIGNAIPIPLGAAIAAAVFEYLRS